MVESGEENQAYPRSSFILHLTRDDENSDDTLQVPGDIAQHQMEEGEERNEEPSLKEISTIQSSAMAHRLWMELW
jgi:hypothetical protein